jgi:hypothetical protein
MAVTFAPTLPDQAAIDTNPNFGGGLCFIPDRPDTAAADAAAPGNEPGYQILKVVADTSLAVGTPVWFKVFDPDDPTENTAPIDPDDAGGTGQPGDNADDVGQVNPTDASVPRLGTGPGSTTSPKVQAAVTKVGTGPNAKYQAVAFVRVPKQPGDNIIVAASANEAELDELRLNRWHLVRTQSSTYGLPSTKSNESQVVTTWRRLRIEQDSMFRVDGNQQVGLIETATLSMANPAAPKLYLRFVPNGDAHDMVPYYQSWFSGFSQESIYVHCTVNSQEVVLEANLPYVIDTDRPPTNPEDILLVVRDPSAVIDNYQDLEHATVTVNDDDDFTLSESKTANEGILLDPPDVVYLQNQLGNILNTAFVKPVLLDLDQSHAFQQNISDEGVRDMNAFTNGNKNTDLHWVVDLTTVFQGDTDSDYDGEGEGVAAPKSSIGRIAPGIGIIRLEHIHEIKLAPNPHPEALASLPTRPGGVAALAATLLLFGGDPMTDDVIKLFADSANAPIISQLDSLAPATIKAIRMAVRPGQ